MILNASTSISFDATQDKSLSASDFRAKIILRFSEKSNESENVDKRLLEVNNEISMRINWKEVFKFLSGATFVGSIVNLYLYLNNIAVPFLGYTITPQLLGLRALVQFILFLVFFYFGFVKSKGA